MPRRLLGIWVLLLVSVLVGRAQGDVVLLTVNDEAVTRSEFEYHFRNSLEKRVDVFLETYGRFKQKVFVAKELGLDTLLSYRRCVEDLLLLMKDQDAGLNISGIGKEWVQLKVVTYPLKQSVGNDEISRGKCYMDSLYNVWQESSFQMEIPSEVSWLQARFLLDEWQKELKNLNRGEWSKPFFSPLGIHLIAWLDRRQGNDFHPEFSFSDSCFRKKGMEEGLLPGDLPNPRIESRSPALLVDS